MLNGQWSMVKHNKTFDQFLSIPYLSPKCQPGSAESRPGELTGTPPHSMGSLSLPPPPFHPPPVQQ